MAAKKKSKKKAKKKVDGRKRTMASLAKKKKKVQVATQEDLSHADVAHDETETPNDELEQRAREEQLAKD